MKKNLNLVKEIIECIPDNYTQLEKARFIYIKLGEILEFNNTFNNTVFAHRFLIKHRNYDLSYLDNNQIMCHNWADIYVDLLRNIGIKAYKQNQYHAWVVFEANNTLIYADATIGEYNDLTRIKYHDEIINFYPISSHEKDKYGLPIRINVEGFHEKIQIIDEKINYQKNGIAAMDSLKQVVSSFPNLEQKIDYLVHYVVKEDTGLNEQFSYFMHAISCCLECSEKYQVHTTEMIKVNDTGKFEFMRCISLEQMEGYKYYILKSDEAFVVSREQLLYCVDDGYGIKSQYNILGINYPLKFKVPKDILLRLIYSNFSLNNPFKSNKPYVKVR